MVAALQGLLGLLGRVMLCGLFIYSIAMEKVPNFDQVSAELGARGLAAPKIVLGALIGFAALGCLFVIVGYWARMGALLLSAVLACATYWLYPFWTIDDPTLRAPVMLQFVKNVSILGALVLILANGGGAWCMDRCCAHQEPAPAEPQA